MLGSREQAAATKAFLMLLLLLLLLEAVDWRCHFCDNYLVTSCSR